MLRPYSVIIIRFFMGLGGTIKKILTCYGFKLSRSHLMQPLEFIY
jgi:hypothetical protein